MKKITGFALFLLSAGAQSQEYVIHHDLIHEKTAFFKVYKQKDTVKVENINLKRSSRIVLEVDNYNPFYWNARVTAFKRPLDEQVSYAGVFNPFSVLSQSLGSVFTNIMPNLDMPDIRSRGSGSDRAEDRFLDLNAAFQRNYKNLQESAQKWEELKFLELQLTDLKYDIKKPESEIKKQAHSHVQKVLDNDTLDFEHTVAISRQLDRKMNSSADSLQLLALQIQKAGSALDQSARIYREHTVKDYMDETNLALSRTQKFPILRDTDQQPFLQKVAGISKLYNEIVNTPFRYHYVLNGEPDITELKLEVYPRVDSLSKDTVVKYFPVSSRTNIRIRNSVGITFAYYKDNNKTYFVKPDSTIGEGKGDLFIPVLSTFIHFYSGGQAGVKWGGTIGFGIPLQGERKDVNFFLGLSSILGRNEPIIISAGLSGGKVNTLGGGYKTGDKVPSETYPLPVKALYKLGAFVSVTFNLSNLSVSSKK